MKAGKIEFDNTTGASPAGSGIHLIVSERPANTSPDDCCEKAARYHATLEEIAAYEPKRDLKTGATKDSAYITAFVQIKDIARKALEVEANDD